MDLTLKAWDAIQGQLGRCVATIDGQQEDMIYLISVEATIDKNKNEIPILGYPGKKHKANGWSGKGKASLYYCTSKFRELMIKYAKTGQDTYFDMIIENEDPNASDIGRQRVLLKQVNIDSQVVAKLDVNSTELDEDIEFTFNGIELLESFIPPVGESL